MELRKCRKCSGSIPDGLVGLSPHCSGECASSAYQEALNEQGGTCCLCSNDNELTADWDTEYWRFRGIKCAPCKEITQIVDANLEYLKRVIQNISDSKSVDDDWHIAETLTEILKKHGFPDESR